MCARTAILDQLTSTRTKICPTGRSMDQHQRFLMLACGSLATCDIDVPMVDQNFSVTFLYDTYVLLLE